LNSGLAIGLRGFGDGEWCLSVGCPLEEVTSKCLCRCGVIAGTRGVVARSCLRKPVLFNIEILPLIVLEQISCDSVRIPSHESGVFLQDLVDHLLNMWHGIVVGRVLNFELTIVAELEGLIVPLAFVPLFHDFTFAASSGIVGRPSWDPLDEILCPVVELAFCNDALDWKSSACALSLVVTRTTWARSQIVTAGLIVVVIIVIVIVAVVVFPLADFRA
jgi:hypothetical protein